MTCPRPDVTLPRLHGRTHRLELADQTLREWDAVVLASDPGQGIVLDRAAADLGR